MWEGNILFSLPLPKILILLGRIELLANQPPPLTETFSAPAWKGPLWSPSHRYSTAPFRPLSHSNSIPGKQAVPSGHILLFSQTSIQPPLSQKEKKKNNSFTCLNIEVWKEASDSLWRDLKALMEVTCSYRNLCLDMCSSPPVLHWELSLSIQ